MMAAALLVVTGCRVATPVREPEVKQLPGTPGNTSDSLGIGDQPWKQFYSDKFLASLVDTAMVNNPDMQMAMQKIAILNQQVLQRRAAFWPTVNAVVSTGVDNYGDYTMNGVGNFDSNLSPNVTGDKKIPDPVTPDYFIGLRSQWEVDLWGKLKSQKKAAIARYEASRQEQRLFSTQMVAQVAGLYYELLSLDNELDILKKNIHLQQQALEVVKIQKQGGRATELAVQQFEAQLLRTQAMEFGVKQQIVGVENELNFLLGRYPQPIRRGTPILQQPLAPTLQQGVPGNALLNRPDIQSAEWQLQAARADVAAVRAAFLPALTINPYAGLNSFRTSVLFTPESIAWGVLGGLSAPVLNRKQLKADLRIAGSQQLTAFYQYQRSLLNAYQEVATQLSNLRNLNEQYGYKEREFAILSSAVSTARDLYLGGYANYLEVITAQKGVLDAELELVNNRRKLFAAQVDLYRALGGGWK